MNPIRRHAYVCAKCHEGASASFATYVVHEPPPLAASTREGFPLFYYGVWWGLIIVGMTGLMLYNPVLTSDYVPGWLLNVVLWVHRVEAVLAMTHIFTIHFFVEHWRPRCFPYSATMFEGSKDIEHLREEHPAWIARMEAERTLNTALCRPAPVPLRILYFGVGYALIGLGVFLLVFGLLNVGLLTLNF